MIDDTDSCQYSSYLETPVFIRDVHPYLPGLRPSCPHNMEVLINGQATS
jgi:hypothetical protein